LLDERGIETAGVGAVGGCAINIEKEVGLGIDGGGGETALDRGGA
jgi:hypothetical protein